MSEQTPSQAEGERDDEQGAEAGQNPSQTTPSQAEGERDDEEGDEKGGGGR
ncbi:hypothetical protein [Streptomyces sp. JHA26]|uniref:hypothetical protein n=1 Tax=Streptomyces sp. JHA26 TaxID=1917143 RepID=UPI0015C552AE|nr:hypothetical protein [Streptomyces sp. JHA26]